MDKHTEQAFPTHPAQELRDQLHQVVHSWGTRHGTTVYMALGVLRVVEADLIAMLPGRYEEPPRRVD